MKKVLVFAVALMLSVLFALSACGTSTLDHKNGLSDLGGEVSSNGGFAVEKGDYVYFVNGIAASSDDNEYGKVETGALVRIKKSDIASPDGKAQTVIPSLFVAGDKTSGVYIFGDKVYFASPVTTKNKEGKVENTKLDFVKVNLDGTGRTIIKTVTDNSTVYRFVEKDSKVYLILKTVNDKSESVIAIYDADGKEVVVTEKMDEYLFDDATVSGTVYYTKKAHNESLDEDEDFNEIHRVSVDGKDEIVFSGNGMIKTEEGKEVVNGIGLTGCTFTLVKDSAEYLYVKVVYVDTSIVNVTRYYAVKKADLKGDDASKNNALLNKESCVNEGSASASTVFAATSLYLNKNCVVYLDSSNGLVLYDWSKKDTDDFGVSDCRVRLFYDKDMIGYTVKFWDNGYLYLVDSNNYYYRVNVGALVDLTTGAVKADADVKLEKVNYLANASTWYLPEVVSVDGKEYFLSVYTSSPYQNLVYATEIKERTDEEIETIRKSEKDSVQANLDTCISVISSTLKETIKKYMKDTFKD